MIALYSMFTVYCLLRSPITTVNRTLSSGCTLSRLHCKKSKNNLTISDICEKSNRWINIIIIIIIILTTDFYAISEWLSE